MSTFKKVLIFLLIIVAGFIYYIYSFLFKPIKKDFFLSERTKYINSLYKLESDVGRILVKVGYITKEGYDREVVKGFFINDKGDVLTFRNPLRGHADFFVFSVATRKNYHVKNILKEDKNLNLIIFSIDKKDLTPHVYPINYEEAEVGERIFGFSTMLYCAVGRIESIMEIPSIGKVYELNFNIPEFSVFNNGRTFDEGTPILNSKKEIIAVGYNYKFTDEEDKMTTIPVGIPIANIKKMKEAKFKNVENMIFKDKTLMTLIRASNSPLSKGIIVFNYGKYEQSLFFFKKALENPESKSEAELYIARVYFKIHKQREAKQLFEKIIDNEPKNYKALCYLGEIYIFYEKYKKAVEVLQKSFRLNNNFCDTKKFLAIAYSELIYPPSELKEYSKFSDNDQEIGENYKLYKKTIGLLKRAQKECGETAENYYYLGKVHEKMEMFDSAAESYYSAIQINNKFTDAYIGLADCHTKTGHWTLAKNTLLKLLEFHEGEARIYYRLGQIYIHLDNIEKAKLMSNKLKELDTNLYYKLLRQIPNK